jgi:hypothetical protein
MITLTGTGPKQREAQREASRFSVWALAGEAVRVWQCPSVAIGDDFWAVGCAIRCGDRDGADL